MKRKLLSRKVGWKKPSKKKKPESQKSENLRVVKRERGQKEDATYKYLKFRKREKNE